MQGAGACPTVARWADEHGVDEGVTHTGCHPYWTLLPAVLPAQHPDAFATVLLRRLGDLGRLMSLCDRGWPMGGIEAIARWSTLTWPWCNGWWGRGVATPFPPRGAAMAGSETLRAVPHPSALSA